MNCQLFFPDSRDLTRQEIDDLWGQDVNLDDWDFMLIVPPDQVQEYDTTEDVYSPDTGRWRSVPCKALGPIEYALQRFEVGCCSNKWYRVTFRGQRVAMLVTYHA